MCQVYRLQHRTTQFTFYWKLKNILCVTLCFLLHSFIWEPGAISSISDHWKSSISPPLTPLTFTDRHQLLHSHADGLYRTVALNTVSPSWEVTMGGGSNTCVWWTLKRRIFMGWTTTSVVNFQKRHRKRSWISLDSLTQRIPSRHFKEPLTETHHQTILTAYEQGPMLE